MALIEGTPFVVFGDDWGRYPSTIQHTFRHIATRHPVVWVNGIGHRVPRLNATDGRRALEKLARLVRGARPHGGNPTASLGGCAPAVIIEPRVLPWHHVGAVRAFNTRSLRHAVLRRLAAVQSRVAPVLVTGSPPSVDLIGSLGEQLSVYYVLDDFLNFPTYTASMLAPLEQQLLERVDMVVATAASLTRSKHPRSGRAYHLPQGVNYDHFSVPRAEPDDLARIPRPRIGFAGSLSTQCDITLLERLALEFPAASLVFVGLVGLDAERLAALNRPNVHVLGLRPYDLLPSYVQHFDVGIIPYVLSGWTVAVDPLKLLEYLAAGLPVVTTSIPEVEKYRAAVRIAEDADAFTAGVRDALGVDRVSARASGQAIARQHTWETRANTFLDLVGAAIDEAPARAATQVSA
jgi:glycosyltransferase involved in cell wall biosynthesis